jgi:hypothetical protein
MRLRAVFALICGLLFAPQVFANDSVRCVQQYLTDVGIDVGGVDGAFGSKTAAGGEIFLDSPQGAQFATLPPLSKVTARVWCDVLIPREPVPAQVVIKDDANKIRDRVEQFVEEGVRQTEALFAANFTNLVHLQPVTVYVSTDGEWLTENYLRDGNLPNGFRQGKLESFGACDPAAEFRGYSVYLCMSHQEWQKGPQTIKGIVAHELFHTVQADLVGARGIACCNNDNEAEAAFGPEWLKEGSAQYMRHVLTYAIGLTDLERDIADLVTNLRGNFNLLDRNNRAGYREHGRDVSENMGVIATHLLVQRSGFDSLANFYRYMGAGLKARDAFKQAFGLSMEEFEVAFISYVELK